MNLNRKGPLVKRKIHQDPDELDKGDYELTQCPAYTTNKHLEPMYATCTWDSFNKVQLLETVHCENKHVYIAHMHAVTILTYRKHVVTFSPHLCVESTHWIEIRVCEFGGVERWNTRWCLCGSVSVLVCVYVCMICVCLPSICVLLHACLLVCISVCV